jgi:hypothetical protein
VAIKLDFYSEAKKEICVSGYPTNPIFVSAKFPTLSFFFDDFGKKSGKLRVFP